MKPTKAEIKELWEGCGLQVRVVDYDRDSWVEWQDPKDIFISRHTPPIDLKNLFKYAEPKAIDQIMAEQECGRTLARSILFKKWTQNIEDGMDTEDALFWALHSIIGKVKEKSNEQG